MRTNRIISGFVVALLACGLTGCPPRNQKQTSKKKAGVTKKLDPADGLESSEQDFLAFVGRLRKAVHAHDVNTLASMMSSGFGYRLEPEGVGDGVFQFWDENNVWPQLDAVISQRFVRSGEFLVAPPEFVEMGDTYHGYRAGIRRENGTWRFAYFVNG